MIVGEKQHVSGGGITATWKPWGGWGWAATLGDLDAGVQYDLAAGVWWWQLWRGSSTIAKGRAATSRAAMVAAQVASNRA